MRMAMSVSRAPKWAVLVVVAVGALLLVCIGMVWFKRHLDERSYAKTALHKLVLSIDVDMLEHGRIPVVVDNGLLCESDEGFRGRRPGLSYRAVGSGPVKAIVIYGNPISATWLTNAEGTFLELSVESFSLRERVRMSRERGN